MPSFKTWQRIFSIIMLTSMIISLVVPAAAAMPAPPNSQPDSLHPATINREASAPSVAPPALPPQQKEEKEERANKKAEAAECSLLDNPTTRGLMSAMFERKLLIECGREAELGQVKSPAFSPSVSRALGTDILVNDPTGEQPTTDKFTQSETSLARNEDSSVICSAYNDSYDGLVSGQGFTGFASSTDKGETWTDHGGIGSDSGGDPANVWSKRDNTFYHASLHTNGLGLWSFGATCVTSTFVSMIHTGANDDKELMAVDNNPSSPYYGRLYVAWTNFDDGHIYVTTSDNATVWSTPVDISGKSNIQGAWPVVDPVTNDVYVAWTHWDAYPDGPIDIEIVRSADGGATWAYVTNPANNVVNPRDSGATGNCGRPAINGDIRYLPSPQIAVDKNSNLHVVYSYDPDGYNSGDVVNVYYRRSTDHGATWEAEIQLNDDGTTTDQWQPVLTVNNNGVVGVFWYDRRLDTANNHDFDYYKAVSMDNGKTFLPNERVSDASSGVVLDSALATCYHGDYDTSIADATRFYIQWSSDLAVGPTPQADPNVWSDTEMILQETGWLSGSVTNANTSQPIENAMVQAQSISYTFPAATNAAGNYATLVASDTYTVTAMAYGYQSGAANNVQVVSGATVIQNFALTPLPEVVISGTVTDAATGWPLYAQIDVSAPGGFAKTVFSNPSSGFYSVTVSTGFTHTFHIGSLIQGYQPATRDIMISAEGTENFVLNADLAACNAPGYQLIGLNEGFEGSVFPPAGWSVADLSGSGRVWAQSATNNTLGSGNAAAADPDANGAGVWDTILYSPAFTVTAPVSLTYASNFQDYAGNGEIWLDISTNGGSAWTNLRNQTTDDPPGGTIETENLTPYVGSNVMFRWHYSATNNTAWYWHIDDISVPLGCQLPSSGGLVVGNVYDANTNTALNGADINNEDGYTAQSAGTPDDPAVDDGFYALFSPAGSKTFTATLASYNADVQSVTVVASDTIRQDFHLPAGQLSASPASMQQTLPLGNVATQTLTLNNTGGAALDFELREKDKGFASVLFGATEDPRLAGGPDAFGYTFRDSTEENGPSYRWIEIAPPAGGSGTAAAFDDTDDGYAWLPDVLSFPFNFYGTDYTGLAFGSNGTVYFENDYLGYSNTHIPGTNSYDISTFIAHYWDDLEVNGAAYYQDMGDKFVIEYYNITAYDGSGSGVWEIILFENGNILLQYQTAEIDPGNTGSGATVGIQGDNSTGLEYSYNTNALSDGLAICFAYPGESENCSGDVPWLAEDPITGTISAAGNASIAVTFDAGQVNQPGNYYADITADNNTPYNSVSVPVTLTVTAPATWGKAKGTITDHCTGQPVEAAIAISGGNPITQTTSMPDGTYVVWLQQGTYPFEYSLPGYVTQTYTLTLTAGTTVTQDVDLVPDKPCLAFTAPKSYEVWLITGTAVYTAPVGLELVNNGAQMLDFEIMEIDGGYTSTLPTRAASSAPVVRKATEIMRLPDGSVDCAAYKNYSGAEPAEVAASCAPNNVQPQTTDNSRLPNAPTDTGFAQDIGFISDNFVSFTLNNFPGQTTLGTQTDAFYGMDFDVTATTLYALNDTTGQLGTINLTNGAFTALVACAAPGGGNWTGLSIDPSSGVFYASTSTDLYTIDPSSDPCGITAIGTFGGGSSIMIDIAVNTAGEMYGHDIATDSIYRIDTATGAATLIGATGYNANYAQGMDFDNDDGTLYIFLYEGGGANRYGTVDLSTGAVTPLATNSPQGEFEGAIQIAGAADVPWLWEEPISGTVAYPGNGSGLLNVANVDIMFTTLNTDTTPMALGTYTATMLVNNNDPAAGTQQIPVIMHIIDQLPSYTLTVHVAGAGTTTPLSGTHVYSAGEVVNLNATPDTGWAFTSWTGDITSAVPTATITMNGSREVTATFTAIPTYTLTISVVGQGTTTPAAGVTTQYSGTVSLAATPASGWAFQNWTGAISTTANPADLLMNANKHVTATFIQTTQYIYLPVVMKQ